MKKQYILIFLFLTLVINISSQNTCSTPYPFISGTTSTYTLPATGINTDLSNDYGCFSNSGYDVSWIYIGVCSPGSIDLEISPITAGLDLDFVAWGPLTAATDCGLDSSQIIDCSISGSLTEIINISSALPGEYYKIMVGRFSFGGPSSAYFNMAQIGGTGNACINTIYACPEPIATQNICQVTTDLLLNQNIIIWEKDTTYTAPYLIQKETTTMGVYSTIATVMNNDTSAYVDSISNPMIQAFKYRIATTDSCGLGTYAYGNVHKTIHLLTSTSSSTGYPQLSWSAYSGFSFGTYYIFRGTSPSTMTLYDSISASFNSYTDIAAISGMNYYSVSVIPASPCQPSRTMNMYSYSNVSPVTFTGINEYEFNQLAIGPNPANDILNFTLGNISADIQIDIIDITGRLILSKSFKNVNQDVISLNEIANGSYIVRFISENKTTHRNIVIAK
ncbi:MAG: T9SS type A sorting domain-containing protein [Bacteroidetes bacterium]|nr:T9SS type A sorting domain-containing protein [Bacteroidota bacterium]